MTILACDLAPSNPTGTSVMPWTAGRAISWMPIARDREARQMQRNDGMLKDIGQPKEDLAGIAYADGVTYIYPSAFEEGPGYLASYLLHERIHFEQFTTPGKGNKMTYAEAQNEAYQAQVDSAEMFFNPTSSKELRIMQDIERFRDDEASTVKLEKESSKGIMGFLRRFKSPPPEMFEAKVHTNAELADIRKLVAQARAQAEIAQRDREEREAATESSRDSTGPVTGFWNGDLDKFRRDLAKLKEPDPGPADVFQNPSTQAPVAAKGALLTHFVTMLPDIRIFAANSCRSPGQISPTEDITRPSENIFFTPAADDAEIERLSNGLGACELNLFRKLIEIIRLGRGPWITSQWVADTARYYSAQTTPRGTNPERAPISRPRERESEPSCEVIDGIRACPR